MFFFDSAERVHVCFSQSRQNLPSLYLPAVLLYSTTIEELLRLQFAIWSIWLIFIIQVFLKEQISKESICSKRI